MSEKTRIAAGEIMRRMNRVTEIWTKIDQFEKYGTTEEEQKGPVRRSVNDMTRPELIQFCFNIYPTISKLKNRIKNEENELLKAQILAELAIREQELLELQKIRDGIV
jgi:hypothetical protein